ncbi:hypothetical protein ID866_10515 [Astraeus odoratus]|nr:hypothetical protein ID866_10515 [Astraeus odoratus]
MEERSFVRDALTTLVVVYGGEAMICLYLTVPPSFVLSDSTPLLYILVQALVEYTPTSLVPIPSPNTELPLSLLDIITNGGLFLANLFSLLQPTPLSFTTPPELLPYGWTTTDLWCAPLVTGLYAALTHAQPFWVDVHAVLGTLVGGHGYTEALNAGKKMEALGPETARAACALVLTGMFVTRTARTFGVGPFKKGITEKVKTK